MEQRAIRVSMPHCVVAARRHPLQASRPARGLLYVCQAERRRNGRNAGWSQLFERLAELSNSVEAAAREQDPKWYRSGRYGENTADQEAEESEAPVVVPVDVEELDDGYRLFMDVPGLQKTDVKVKVFPQQRTITISGERQRATQEAWEQTPGRSYRRRYERPVGKFSRTVRLAKNLDITTISAQVDKGVLMVSARKLPAAEPAAESVNISVD